jgi:hypothetical protein
MSGNPLRSVGSVARKARGPAASAIEAGGLAAVVYGLWQVSHPGAWALGGVLTALAVEFGSTPKPPKRAPQ